MKRPAKEPSKLSDSVHHQLNMYALAASAAGVGLLALAYPAAAKIIPTCQTKGAQNGYIPNCTGHPGLCMQLGFVQGHFAFNIPSVNYAYSASLKIVAKKKTRNAVIGTISYPQGTSHRSHKKVVVSALAYGDLIGPSIGRFYQRAALAGYNDNGGKSGSGSQWGKWWGSNYGKSFVGVKFYDNHRVHFGWVQITSGGYGEQIGHCAFESIPDKAIRAGHQHGPDVKPATLHRLAKGASAIKEWRGQGDSK
jgi:hypothetical protein